MDGNNCGHLLTLNSSTSFCDVPPVLGPPVSLAFVLLSVKPTSPATCECLQRSVLPIAYFGVRCDGSKAFLDGFVLSLYCSIQSFCNELSVNCVYEIWLPV